MSHEIHWLTSYPGEGLPLDPDELLTMFGTTSHNSGQGGHWQTAHAAYQSSWNRSRGHSLKITKTYTKPLPVIKIKWEGLREGFANFARFCLFCSSICIRTAPTPCCVSENRLVSCTWNSCERCKKCASKGQTFSLSDIGNESIT